jgi:hypothetical protein
MSEDLKGYQVILRFQTERSLACIVVALSFWVVLVRVLDAICGS